MRTKIYWSNQGLPDEYVGDVIGTTFYTWRSYPKHYFRIFRSFFAISIDLLNELIKKYAITTILIEYSIKNRKEYYSIQVDRVLKFGQRYINEVGNVKDEQLVVPEEKLKQLNEKPDILKENILRYL